MRPTARHRRVAHAFNLTITLSGFFAAETTTCTWFVLTLIASSDQPRNRHLSTIASSIAALCSAPRRTGALRRRALIAFARTGLGRTIAESKAACSRSTDPRASPWTHVPYVVNVKEIRQWVIPFDVGQWLRLPRHALSLEHRVHKSGVATGRERSDSPGGFVSKGANKASNALTLGNPEQNAGKPSGCSPLPPGRGSDWRYSSVSAGLHKSGVATGRERSDCRGIREQRR